MKELVQIKNREFKRQPRIPVRGLGLNSWFVGEWKCLMRGLFEHASFSANDEVKKLTEQKKMWEVKQEYDQWRLSSTLPRRGYNAELLHKA